MKWYGNLTNRLNENKQFVKEIKVGDGATEYLYSDSHAYEVTKVIDQEHIFIRRMDAKNKAAYDNDWTYKSNLENPEIELQLRKGKWNIVNTYTKEKLMERAKLHNISNNVDCEYCFYVSMAGLTDYQKQKLEEGKEVKKYTPKNFSIGVMEEYYDWSF